MGEVRVHLQITIDNYNFSFYITALQLLQHPAFYSSGGTGMKKVCIIFMYIIFLSILTSSPVFGGLFDKSEYAARRSKLMKMIPDGIAILFGAQKQVAARPFFQNNNFMYFTGVEIPDAILIIDGMKKKSTLFFTISENTARAEGISLNLVRNPEEVTGIEKVYPIEQFSSYLSGLSVQTDIFYTSFKPEELRREYNDRKYNGILQNTTRNEWDGRLTKELRFIKILNERYPHVTVKDCTGSITELRIIKSPAEIEIIRKAGRIGVKAHIELLKSTYVGVPEYELAALYEFICKKEGAECMGYNTIICSGENHPFGHYHKHNRILEDSDFLVIDIGPSFGYYVVDITVSYPVNGRFTARQKKVYTAANEWHKACLSVYKPGITIEEAKEKVQVIMKNKGFDLSNEIFRQRTMQRYFGHYVGMAVHDVGGAPAVLKPGMVFVNEPAAKYPDENLGVRIEDTIVITEDGYENLTPGIPREIDEIEAVMKEKGLLQILRGKTKN